MKLCDCFDVKFNDTTMEQLKSGEVRHITPQPDPNCSKCKGSGYIQDDILKYNDVIGD